MDRAAQARLDQDVLVTLKLVRYLSHGHRARVATLVKYLGFEGVFATALDVEYLLTKDGRFAKGGRGWWRWTG